MAKWKSKVVIVEARQFLGTETSAKELGLVWWSDYRGEARWDWKDRRGNYHACPVPAMHWLVIENDGGDEIRRVIEDSAFKKLYEPA